MATMTAISSNPLWQHYRIVLILRDELMKKIRNPNKKQSQRDKLTQKTLRILQVPTKCETTFFLLYSLLYISPFSTVIWLSYPKLCIFQHCCEIVMREAAENVFYRLILFDLAIMAKNRMWDSKSAAQMLQVWFDTRKTEA